MTAILIILGIIISVLLGKWALGFKLERRQNRHNESYTAMGWNPGAKKIVVALLLIVSYISVASSSGQMSEGMRGVVLHNGAATGRVIEPGFYVTTPVLDTVEPVDVTIHAESVTAESASIDLQVVTTEITANYHVDPIRVVKVYHDYRHDVVTRALKPAILEAVKASTAKFKAEELITKRSEVKTEIERALRERLDQVGLILDNVSVTDFDFAKAYNDAIEAKVTAMQKALQAENDLKRIKVEAEQTVTKRKAEADSEKLDADAKAYALKVNAEAQAEALKLQKDGATKELIELRRVEAMLKALEKWDGRMPTYVGGGQSPVPVLDVFSVEKK